MIFVASNTIDTILLSPSIFRYCFNCSYILISFSKWCSWLFSLCHFPSILSNTPAVINVSIYISNDPFITSTIFNVALFNFLSHLPSSLDTSNLTSCRPISSQCSLQYIEKNECHLSVVIFYSTNAADHMYVTYGTLECLIYSLEFPIKEVTAFYFKSLSYSNILQRFLQFQPQFNIL